MNTNLFEEFQLKKKKVRNLADAALRKGWIEKADYDGIINKLDTDTLTIGVIGQMKCGKSTFLNAFLFNDTVLPAATNPMTAALSVITYGEEKNIVAEFYTQDEWAGLKMQAEKKIDESTPDEEINMKQAASEVLAKSKSIAGEIPSLLGKTKTDTFENLIEYVGADGKYVSITRSVTIHYPVEWLKGVEIVDTPGFNDPIVSREVRTQEFLKKADVVLLLLYAGRAFDATDRDILFEKVRKVGVGKILLGVNKYDVQIDKESEDQIRSNVEEELRKACKDPKYRDDLIIQETMRGIKPILLSANMALMARMPLNKVYADPDMKFHFDQSCSLFGNEKQDQRQMLKDSLIENLENAVREIIEKSKADILIKKPVNHIFQLAQNRHDELDALIKEDESTLNELKKPDNELEDRLDGIKKAQKRIERKIERAVDELSAAFDEITDSGIDNMQTIVLDAKKDCIRIAETAERKNVGTNLNTRIEQLCNLALPKEQKSYKKAFIKELDSHCEQFANDVEEVLEKYIEDCDDVKEAFRSAVKRGATSIKEGADEREMELFGSDFENKSLALLVKIIIPVRFLYALFDNWREDVHNEIESHFRQYNFASLKAATLARRPAYLNLLRTEATSKLLGDLVEELTKALESKEEKEKMIKEKELSIQANKKKMSELEAQIAELKSIVNQ